MVGIASYGTYIPRNRLTLSDIAAVWGKTNQHIEKTLGVAEKSIAGYDEDTVTIGYEAGNEALRCGAISPDSIGALFVGSESHPYAVNPTTTIIGEFLGLPHEYYAADTEFACKAGSTGIIIVDGLLQTDRIQYGMAIGADCAQAKPHDILEYTAASGGASFVLTNNKESIIAELVDTVSYSSDTPDFWRRDGVSYPSHGGRFTGEPAYFKHVIGATNMLLRKTKLKPVDFSHIVFHMPNAKFPKEAAKRLGFLDNTIAPSFIVDTIGNPYSASSLIGLASVLDQAKPHQYILMVSYGSGAGSDAFVFKTTKKIASFQKRRFSIIGAPKLKKYISYVEYLKMRGRI